MNLGVLLLTGILLVLIVALFVGIDKLIEIAGIVAAGSAGFAEGIVLTAVVGIITTFLSTITLIVKAIVDSITSRKPDQQTSRGDHSANPR